MKSNKNIFKVGDKVFDYTYGWGVVDEANDTHARVKFDRSGNNTVLYWGIFLKTLSFTEYTLEGFSQERPEPLPKPGDVVWVRDTCYDSWMITYFRKFNNDATKTYGCNPRNSADSLSIYYYKYLTTKNPYENKDPRHPINW